ncbi:MAG: DNA-directed RNA polymerase subunit B'' [Candidatus Micrarchaeia archaeon]|jgi:DNA-directed RNA polymerase beta subunit
MANEILEAYLSSVSLVQQQIDSFNRFLEFGVQRVISKQGSIQPNIEDFSLKLGRVRLEKPSIIEADSSRRSILPNEARLRNLTYAAPIFLEFIPVIRGIEKEASYGEVFIGELPIMVGSSLCHTMNMPREQLIKSGEDPEDPGGYFIIKGTERVLIGLEDLAPNRIITTKEKGGLETTSKIFSTVGTFRARCAITRNQRGMFSVNFPNGPKNTDLILLVRALGLTMNKVLEYAGSIQAVKNDFIFNIEMSDAKDMGPSEALLAIGKLAAPGQAEDYQKKRAETILDTYLLPHIGISPNEREEKAKFIIEAAKRASLVANKYIKQDDKDHYANKRLKLAGELMEELFAYAFKFFVKDIKYQIERTSARGRKMSIQTIVSSDTLTSKILYAMGTGTWVAGQTGVSQVLDRTNMMSTYAHLRRVKSPLAKKHPHFKARDVHGTQWGKICPSESPEGQEVGLTKYLAMMAKVTTGADEKFTEEKLAELGLKKDR